MPACVYRMMEFYEPNGITVARWSITRIKFDARSRCYIFTFLLDDNASPIAHHEQQLVHLIFSV